VTQKVELTTYSYTLTSQIKLKLNTALKHIYSINYLHTFLSMTKLGKTISIINTCTVLASQYCQTW